MLRSYLITFYLLSFSFFFLIHFRLMDVEEQFLDYVPVGELILRSYATRQLVSLGGTMVGRGIRFLNAQTCSKLIEQIQDNAFFHQDF